VETVQAELLRVATALASSRKWRSVILEKPEIWGLESISAEALVTRLVVKTRVSAKWDFARDLRLHMKKALDGVGVSLTPLNSVVMAGADGSVDSGRMEPLDPDIDAAEEAAAALPDAISTVHTAPVPVRKTPRGTRKPKTPAAVATTRPVPKVPPKGGATEPATRVTPPATPPVAKSSSTPDPEIREDE